MQRRLILMRHADAASGLPDHARPLSPEGQRAAARTARQLEARGWLPHAALVSDAVRTVETYARMRAEVDALPEPAARHALYLAEPYPMAEMLAELDEGSRTTALVLAHNPGISELAGRLTNVRISLAPAWAALLEGEHESWAGAMDWRLVEVLRPG